MAVRAVRAGGRKGGDNRLSKPRRGKRIEPGQGGGRPLAQGNTHLRSSEAALKQDTRGTPASPPPGTWSVPRLLGVKWGDTTHLSGPCEGPACRILRAQLGLLSPR